MPIIIDLLRGLQAMEENAIVHSDLTEECQTCMNCSLREFIANLPLSSSGLPLVWTTHKIAGSGHDEAEPWTSNLVCQERCFCFSQTCLASGSSSIELSHGSLALRLHTSFPSSFIVLAIHRSTSRPRFLDPLHLDRINFHVQMAGSCKTIDLFVEDKSVINRFAFLAALFTGVGRDWISFRILLWWCSKQLDGRTVNRILLDSPPSRSHSRVSCTVV